MIELPVTVRAEPDEIIQGVHHRASCLRRACRQAGWSEPSATALIGWDRSSRVSGRCSAQYLFRRGTGTPHTRHCPAGLRFGTRTLFCLAAQDREQNFGFRVSRPQTGHTATAILSEGWLGSVVARMGPRPVPSVSCAETVRSPPKPGRQGEDTVQPTNAQGRRRKPKWDETVGRRSESCRGYSSLLARFLM